MKKPKFKNVICIIAGVIGVFLILFYGPIESFRLLWINTAMYSSRFKFLATSFYSKKYIDEVIDISFPHDQTNIQYFENDCSDEIYLNEISGKHYQGYIVKIMNPRRLLLITSKQEEGEILEDLCFENHVLGGINGGGYKDHQKRGLPWGILIVNGELVCTCIEHQEHSIVGFTKAHQLIVGHMKEPDILRYNFEWAIEFGPILIINGEKTELNTYSGGYAPRTAIGQTKEGYILLIVIDGRQPSSIGATFRDIQMILYENGALNAIGLDGGSSSSMFFQGRLINKPSEGDRERLLPNALVFK